MPVDAPNTVTATFADPAGNNVVATDDALVKVIHPQIALEVTPAETAIFSGDTVSYTYTVTNPGNIALDVSKDDDTVEARTARRWSTRAATRTPTACSTQGRSGSTPAKPPDLRRPGRPDGHGVRLRRRVRLPGVSDSDVLVTVNVIDPSITITKVATDATSGRVRRRHHGRRHQRHHVHVLGREHRRHRPRRRGDQRPQLLADRARLG
jgi:hypothetical protein